jgi:hypothetical protein
MNRIIASGSQVGVADGKDVELVVPRHAGKKVVIVSNEQRVLGDTINNHIVAKG